MRSFFRYTTFGVIWLGLITGIIKPDMARSDDSETIKIAAFGDSLVAGYGLDREKGFSPVLEARLRAEGHNVDVVNLGVSGDTTKMGLKRLNWSIGDDIDVVLLELGANDGLRGLNPELTRKNLDAMLIGLKKRKLPVLLVAMMAPRSFDDAYIARFDSIYPDLAEKHNVRLSPFFLEGVAGRPELNQKDGIHPNEKGVEIVVNNILPSVIGLLSEHRLHNNN